MRLLSISVALACRLNNSPPSPWAMDCLLVIQATAKFPAGMATTIPPSVSALGCHLRGCVLTTPRASIEGKLSRPSHSVREFRNCMQQGPSKVPHGHCHCYPRSIYTRVLNRRSAGDTLTIHASPPTPQIGIRLARSNALPLPLQHRSMRYRRDCGAAGCPARSVLMQENMKDI